MNGPASLRGRVVVIGGGAVGLAVALEAARRGRRVKLFTDGATPSASASAAGMLAPASEALLDRMDAGETALLVSARGRWDAWAPRLGLELACEGSLHLAAPPELRARAARARALGLATTPREGGLWLAQDALIDPATALALMTAAAAEAGVELSPARAEAADGGLRVDGEALDGEVVIAAGWGSAALAEAAPELAALHPIRGQLLCVAAPPASGPMLRGPDVYLAPSRDGWTVGATMEVGCEDLDVDPVASERLHKAAAALRPELARRPAHAVVGVRAATADGRPLVGRSRSGVWLATGMRRNGWLLAPLVAETLVALISWDTDAASSAQARAWSPDRALPLSRFPTAGESL